MSMQSEDTTLYVIYFNTRKLPLLSLLILSIHGLLTDCGLIGDYLPVVSVLLIDPSVRRRNRLSLFVAGDSPMLFARGAYS